MPEPLDSLSELVGQVSRSARKPDLRRFAVERLGLTTAEKVRALLARLAMDGDLQAGLKAVADGIHPQYTGTLSPAEVVSVVQAVIASVFDLGEARVYGKHAKAAGAKAGVELFEISD